MEDEALKENSCHEDKAAAIATAAATTAATTAAGKEEEIEVFSTPVPKLQAKAILPPTSSNSNSVAHQDLYWSRMTNVQEYGHPDGPRKYATILIMRIGWLLLFLWFCSLVLKNHGFPWYWNIGQAPDFGDDFNGKIALMDAG